MIRLLVAMMLMIPLSAGAATYSWTDASGTVNFTDDLGAVPPKYRAKALQKTAGEDPVPETKQTVTPAPAAKNATAAPPATEKKAIPDAAVPADTPVSSSTRFGDRSAGEWQTEFRGLRGQLKAIEQQFEELKRQGGDGKTFLTSSKITELNTRSKQLNQEYEAVRLRLNALVDQANKAGLPPEFGQ